MQLGHFFCMYIVGMQYTDMAKKSKDGLRDIARVRPGEIATREIPGYRVEPHNINAICVQYWVSGQDATQEMEGK